MGWIELLEVAFSTHPIIAAVVSSAATVIVATYLFWKLSLRKDKIIHNIYKDMAILYSEALHDARILSEEIRSSRSDLRKLSKKATQMARFLTEVHEAIEDWNTSYPPSERDIQEILNKFRKKG